MQTTGMQFFMLNIIYVTMYQKKSYENIIISANINIENYSKEECFLQNLLPTKQGRFQSRLIPGFSVCRIICYDQLFALAVNVCVCIKTAVKCRRCY